MNIDIYLQKTNKTYKTKYGIPFQCVELIRRFFCTIKGISFPDVTDAVDFFNKINSFYLLKNLSQSIELKIFSYPYIHTYSYYLKPGSILFYKYKTNFPDGHVALILDSTDKETIVIQQNLNPPIKIYNTSELFEKINCPKSRFLGIKRLPNKYTSNIKNVKCTIVKL